MAIMALLAGCLGGGKPPAPAGATGPTAATETSTPDPGPGGDLDDQEHKAHHHNYWGDELTQVVVFDGPVTLQTLPLDRGFYEGCNAIGYAEFDFEADGDDVNQDANSAVNEVTNKADVIFPGTSRIVVNIQWNEQDAAQQQIIPGIVAQYKPANQGTYKMDTTSGLKRSTCGVFVQNGEDFEIPVLPLQFDPAHQVYLSRWKFRLWAGTEPTSSGGNANNFAAPAVGLGQVHVRMTGVYGGETFLDPPHPDFYRETDTTTLDAATGHQNFTLVADHTDGCPTPCPASSPLGYKPDRDITLPRGSIISMGTTSVDVTLCLTPDGAIPQNPQTVYRLAYHGAETAVFTLLEPSGNSGDCQAYRIDDPTGGKVDDPYQINSQWVFRIVPVTNGTPHVGYFQGTYELTTVTHGAPIGE